MFATGATAQRYPQRPIQVVVPTSAGGGVDMIARTIGQKLTAALGQTIVVDNRPGAGGVIGVALVAKAAPDGYSLLVASGSHVAVNPSLVRAPFDPVRDLAPVSLIASGPLILVVHPSVPVKSVKDLIALAKAKKGALNYGSAGIGTTSHVGVELFKSMTQTDIVHIPFKGNSLATAALISGEIDVMLDSPTNALPHVRSGRLRALAVGTLTRSSVVPELPTVAEAGVPGFEADAWYSMLAPAGTPNEIILRLGGEIAKAVRMPDVRQQLAHAALDPVGSTPAEFAAYLKSELTKWAGVIRSARIRSD
ncbi:MAG: tripartite tricarboxylate transporter substrate binding protein [Sulfuricaulis sp.]|nr:tripartite tricarboxylate transporter substrate binding protein [Sulfuricaulis sp.]